MSLVAWVEARKPRMPEPLRLAVRAALDDEAPAGETDDSAVVADGLADAAVRILARVLEAEPDRSAAAALLAADALLTYACEAAAEAGPETLDRITARLDAARLAALLETGDR